jgi:predicted O-linked N-acetylglucosamine transferase (SPINDLY family)
MELTIDQALQQGVAAHKEGKLQDAERLYRAILQAQPEHPDANHNLGVLAVAVGNPLEAIPLFKIALEVNPQIEQFWLSYIDTLITVERFDEAKRVVVEGKKSGVASEKLDAISQHLQGKISSHKTKIAKGQTLSEKRKQLAEKKKSKKRKAQGSSSTTGPSQDQLNHLVGHYQSGRFEEAESLAESLTQQFPRHPFGWKVLGVVLQQTGRLAESLAPMQAAVKLSPQDAQTHSNLGATLKELGRFDEAEASCRQAIAMQPDFADAHYNLGKTLKALSRLDESEASYKKATIFRPDFAEAHNDLGNTLQELGRLDEAEASFSQAIALKPAYAEAHYNLGNTLKALVRLDESEASYKQAINLKPDYADAHLNLGNTLKALGRLDEAEASYKQAITLKPDLGDAYNNLLMLIGSMPFNEVRYLESAGDFARAVKAAIASRFDTWSHSQDRESLRIGFVSGDLSSHPVGYFLESLLMELQSSSVELFAYPTTSESDAITFRIKPLFDIWFSLVGLDDDAAAQKIHEDRIHILIDLSGHTAKNRLPIFARKPAPIQVSWLGYFASTGLPEMDYILGDPYVTPHKEAEHFVETIWQLPESYLCFTPPSEDVKVAPLPASINGFITFGCFNNIARMTDEVVAVRAAILHAVPDSKLFLKDKQFDNEAGRSRVLSRFATLDVGPDRLILEGKSSRKQYLTCYHRVDIALSPFPYGGGTTSVEGLWMGVPVITKKGNHFLSHLGESIAHNSGLSDWIAVDEEDYIAKAVAFASDLESLSALRKGMREQILHAPLLDAPRFARHFEKALRAMRSKLA